MKTIILYATKYGAAAEIAQRIANKIDGAVIHNLKQGIPSLAEFDCIILGSPVYAGSIRREAKEFLAKNAGLLLDKKFALFLSGIGANGENKLFESNFPPKILQKAKAAGFLGGIFDPKKANAVERFIIKIAAKKSMYINTIDDSEIELFAEKVKL